MVFSIWRTGEVSAVVGGRDIRFAGFNRALDARRSIGSLVKPAVYLTGLQKGYNLASPLKDAPLTMRNQGGQVWQPKNYDKGYRGSVPLYQAMAESLNLPTVRLGLDVGVDKVAATLPSLGVTTKKTPRRRSQARRGPPPSFVGRLPSVFF